jgi:hypothetical protein
MVRQKIGVLTFHRCINYGSYWQARCLVEGLRAMGHDAVLLDHVSTRVNWREWRCALQPRLPVRSVREDVAAHHSKTRQFFEAFSRLPLSRAFPPEDSVGAERFDVIIVGSDEVWNLRHPWYGGYSIFYGEGLKTDRLVSYAASFGNYPASDRLPEHWADLLGNFAALSVRDENSARIVRDAVGHQPDLVLDPCLLFAPSAEPHPSQVEAPYAALYGHGFPDWFSTAARQWAVSRGLRLISIGYRNDWADEQHIAAGPERFAQLMAGASAIVTNFFHGCVFALLNAKPFACVSSDYRANKLRDLMQTAGTSEHLITAADAENLPDLLRNPLGKDASNRLALLRARSFAYLQKAIAP